MVGRKFRPWIQKAGGAGGEGGGGRDAVLHHSGKAAAWALWLFCLVLCMDRMEQESVIWQERKLVCACI